MFLVFVLNLLHLKNICWEHSTPCKPHAERDVRLMVNSQARCLVLALALPCPPGGTRLQGTRPERHAALSSAQLSSSLCSFPLPICATHWLQRIRKKIGTRFKEKESEDVGSPVPVRGVGATRPRPGHPHLLEAMTWPDPPGLCRFATRGYPSAGRTLHLARKAFSFSFHLCQCCLRAPKGIFRKRIIRVMESGQE